MGSNRLQESSYSTSETLTTNKKRHPPPEFFTTTLVPARSVNQPADSVECRRAFESLETTGEMRSRPWPPSTNDCSRDHQPDGQATDLGRIRTYQAQCIIREEDVQLSRWVQLSGGRGEVPRSDPEQRQHGLAALR